MSFRAVEIMNDHIIIIGASHAGVSFAEAMRSNGFAGHLTMIERLAGMPMERPPLSKAFLLNDNDSNGDGGGDAKFYLRKSDWFAAKDIVLRDGVSVTNINAADHTIDLDDGTQLPYDKLVLATGAVPHMLAAAKGLANVHVVRDPSDAAGLRSSIATAKSAIVIGGGYIGLETATSLRKTGLTVAVIEAADRLLARVASPAISEFFADLHTANGVTLHIGAGAASIDSIDGVFCGVTLDDGTKLTADMLIVGIGVAPDMNLANMANLDCGNGILVGADMQTSDAAIYAIGDAALCAATAPQVAGTPIRVESVHNAQDSAARAAAAINGHAAPAWQAPWFWSEQYDARLQSAGIVPPAGEDVVSVLRPGKREDGLSCWSFANGALHAIEAVRDPKSYMLGKKCLDVGKSPTPEQAADPEFDIKAFLAD